MTSFLFGFIVHAKIINPAIGNLGTLNADQFTEGMLRALIEIGLVVGGILFMFMILFGGIKWLTSSGDKVQLESARKMLANALVGVVVVFCLYAIVNLVGCFFGLNLLDIKIGNFNVGFGPALCGGSSSGGPVPSSVPVPTTPPGIPTKKPTSVPPKNSPTNTPTYTPTPTPCCTGINCTQSAPGALGNPFCSWTSGCSLVQCCQCVNGDDPTNTQSGPVYCCTPPGGCSTPSNIRQGCLP